MVAAAGNKQCEVVLVGCGAPNRGMGWYHAVQMLKGKCPSAKLCFVVEPWFMGAGKCRHIVYFWSLDDVKECTVHTKIPTGEKQDPLLVLR